ncbi:MAG TPA: hypothetical protein VFD66_07570, partial [Verrucomicrobiae bacterium]|nr:hypothetical protein [Verrucomicrobiae bacterium]
MNRQLIYKVGALLAAVLLLNLVWFDYVRRESTVYSWDNDGYWAKCWNFERELETNPRLFVLDTLRSIRNDDYTAEPTIPTALVLSLGAKLHLFSYSRAAYILTNGNLYIIPSLLLVVWLVSALWNQRFSFALESVPPAVWIAVAIMALTPALWLPLYRGYPDGGGLVFCFLITGLFLRWHDKPRSPRDELLSWIAMVVLLVGLVFFRRWYLYWILWFWVAAGVVCLWDAWGEWRRGSRTWGIFSHLAKFCGAAVSFIVLLAIVSPHFVRQLVSYNYADRYMAFRLSKTFGEFLVNTFSAPGIVTILLFAGGIVYALINPSLRTFAVLQLIQLGGIVVHFGRTQDFGPHHHYLLLALMLPVTTLFVAELIRRFQWRPVVCLVPIGLLAYMLSFTTVQGAPRMVKPLIGVV